MANSQEWLNANAGRSYPFREDASRLSAGGGVAIPNELLLDFVFTLPPENSNTMHLSELLLGHNILVLTFADQADSVVGSAVIPVSTHSSGDAYPLAGVGNYLNMRGQVVIGDLTIALVTMPAGHYTFDADATAMEATTLRTSLRGLSGLQVATADGQVSDTLTGLVRLVAGTGVRLRVLAAGDSVTITNPDTGAAVVKVLTAPAIQIDVAGPGYTDADAIEADTPLPPPIRTINGLPADESGNVELSSVSSCLMIDATGHTLTFDDDCSEPCCGCPELELLTQNLKALDASGQTMQEKLVQLEATIMQFWVGVAATIR